MDLLLRIQADQLGIRVRRPLDRETTSLGAAYLAGLAHGVWTSTGEISDKWMTEAVFDPSAPGSEARRAAQTLHATWLRAVERTRDWVGSES